MYCEVCKILFGTHWNFKRHQKQQHTDKNTPEMIAGRLEQNQRRNLSRRERYASQPVYKEKMKSLSKNNRMKRASFDRDDGSEDVGDRKKYVKRENVLDTDPVAVGKVGGSEEGNVSSRGEKDVADCTGGNPPEGKKSGGFQVGKESGVFQVETKPLTDKDILYFFKPRSCVPGCL